MSKVNFHDPVALHRRAAPSDSERSKRQAPMMTLRRWLRGLMHLPSRQVLAEMNERLRREAEAHEATLRELEASRRELETRVIERTRELSLVKARFETALHGAKVAVFSQDCDLRYTWMSSPDGERADTGLIGRGDGELPASPQSAAIDALKRKVVASGEPGDGEFRIDGGTPPRWQDLHVEPMRDATGAVVGVICAAVDITARKAGEAHLRDLLRELTHRSKNLLAVIQAMARQTAHQHTGTVDHFLERFSARLQALAASHDLLIQESWYGASLAELVHTQLGHHLDRERPQVSAVGPALLLKPEAAQSIGLALHELATNAAKYGALSVPAGRVEIAWRRLPKAEGEGIEIRWTEHGGPDVRQPERRGFGSLVIERNLARALDAEVALAFVLEGVRCRIKIPAASVAAGR
jgi:two-component sensor histidine kinase